MPDADLERIAERLRASRQELERDMDDTDKNVKVSELLERIEALKKRIEGSSASFGSVAAAAGMEPTMPVRS